MDKTSSVVRTRFAPSPTGYLHVGGARTALFNYLYAKAMGGKFILRIEDTDQSRSTEESYREMLESIDWLGLTWDEGPEVGGDFGSYRQSERLDIYKKHAQQLIDEKKAYHCFCSAEELENKKKKREAMGLPPVYDGKCSNLNDEEILEKRTENIAHTIRFKTKNKEVMVADMVQGDVRFDTSLIGDFIIVKSDGFPSYNFAVVVDDKLMQINHIIRGVGHLSNTPRQILIYEAFNWQEPQWAHVSEIVGSDHKKLSKRHGAAAITVFRDLGYPMSAFVNYMSLLGWSPPDGNEYMSVDRIISQFDVARCNKSPAMFDVFDLKKASDIDLNDVSKSELKKYLYSKSKLNWISNQNIRELPESDYLMQVMPFVIESKKVPVEIIKSQPDLVNSILLKLRVYLDYMDQIGEYISGFFTEEVDFTPDAKFWLQEENSSTIVSEFKKSLENLATINEESIKKIINETGVKTGFKGKKLFMTLRSAITGNTAGLELHIFISLLGKEKVINRLNNM